jgi:hypothetical protein
MTQRHRGPRASGDPQTYKIPKIGICPLLGYYAALSGSSAPTFRDNLSVPSSSVKKSKKDFLALLEDGTDRLSRNVYAELPLNVA